MRAAWGLLVEALRARGVAAYGFDISFFSSGAYPPHERHLNALGPADWDGVFASEGFQRDASLDASFMTPWAAYYFRTA